MVHSKRIPYLKGTVCRSNKRSYALNVLYLRGTVHRQKNCFGFSKFSFSALRKRFNGIHLVNCFSITNGVRQGGILSAYLSNIYINQLSAELNQLVASQKQSAQIAVNRLYCRACELRDLLTYYANLLALRFGCCYSVASICDVPNWSSRVTVTYFPFFELVS